MKFKIKKQSKAAEIDDKNINELEIFEDRRCIWYQRLLLFGLPLIILATVKSGYFNQLLGRLFIIGSTIGIGTYCLVIGQIKPSSKVFWYCFTATFLFFSAPMLTAVIFIPFWLLPGAMLFVFYKFSQEVKWSGRIALFVFGLFLLNSWALDHSRYFESLYSYYIFFQVFLYLAFPFYVIISGMYELTTRNSMDFIKQSEPTREKIKIRIKKKLTFKQVKNKKNRNSRLLVGLKSSIRSFSFSSNYADSEAFIRWRARFFFLGLPILIVSICTICIL